MVRYHGRCDGRDQSKFVSTGRTLCRPGRYSGAGKCGNPTVGLRIAAELGRDPRLDRTDPDVSEPRGRNLRDMCRSIPPIQSDSFQSNGGLLLVGLGANLRAYGAIVGLSNQPVVFTLVSSAIARILYRIFFHGRQLVRREVGNAFGDADRRWGRQALHFSQQ